MEEYVRRAPIPGFDVLLAVPERLIVRRVTRVLTLPKDTRLSVHPHDRSSIDGRLTYTSAVVVPSHDGSAWVFAVGEFEPIAPDRVTRKPTGKQGELAVFQLNTLERAADDQTLIETVGYCLCDPHKPSRAFYKARPNGQLVFCREHPLKDCQGFVRIVTGKMQVETQSDDQTTYVYVHPDAAGTIADQLGAALQLEGRPPPSPSPT